AAQEALAGLVPLGQEPAAVHLAAEVQQTPVACLSAQLDQRLVPRAGGQVARLRLVRGPGVGRGPPFGHQSPSAKGKGRRDPPPAAPAGQRSRQAILTPFLYFFRLTAAVPGTGAAWRSPRLFTTGEESHLILLFRRRPYSRKARSFPSVCRPVSAG